MIYSFWSNYDPELTTGIKKTNGFIQEWIVLFIIVESLNGNL